MLVKCAPVDIDFGEVWECHSVVIFWGIIDQQFVWGYGMDKLLQFHHFLCYVITYPCPNFIVKLLYEWVITSYNLYVCN